MSTNYDLITKEYQASKLLPWRIQAEAYTFFKLLGNLNGLDVLDLACGEGFYTRQIKLHGAAHVTGIDISEGMIHLALEIEAKNPLGLEYYIHDAMSMDLNKKFDMVCASYLLNYAQDADELTRMSRVIAHHLKPGGRFVTINSNPDFDYPVDSMFHYGFTREDKGVEEGDEIIFSFFKPDGSHIEVINYHLNRSTHDKALSQEGLGLIQWHTLEVSPEGNEEHGDEYWVNIKRCQPVIGITAMKP
ncbi:MAG: class I SAM-dependent methyltransferase [Saprospiraceae bacterium]